MGGKSASAGLGSGVVTIWLWGLAMPDQPMPPEVAAAIAALLMTAADAIGRAVGRLFPGADEKE